MARLIELNAQLPENIRLSDSQIGTVQRTQQILDRHKLQPETTAEKEEEERIKRPEFGPAFVNQFGDLVQKNLDTGRIEKISASKDDKGITTPTLSSILALKKNFQAQSKDFIGIMSSFAQAETARDLFISGGTGAQQAWQTLNVTFQKAIDPESVVRESEFARTEGFQSLIGRMENAISRGLTGEATPELVEEVFANIKVLKDAAQEGQRIRKRNHENIAREFGIEPSFITGGVVAPEEKVGFDPVTGQHFVEE
jgi:hypothetical protein